MSIIYSISTSKKSTLQGIPKPSGMIIVIRILMHTDTQEVWTIGRNSKKQSRKQNKSSLMKKSMKLPTRDVVHRSL